VNFKELRWEGMDWIYLTEDRDKWQAVVSTIINLQVSQNVENFFTDIGTVSF
jgi:hypothetical protein